MAEEKKAKKRWIKSAIKHPGALHRELGVPEGEKIPAAKLERAAAGGGKLGKEARLAETLMGFHHGKAKAEKLYTPKHLRRAG